MQKELTPQESLQLIQSMIHKTKVNISENRFYFLLWGWLTIAAILAQYTLKVFIGYRHHYFAWLLTLVGILVSIIYSKRSSKNQQVRTYIGESMAYLWTGMGISFFILSFLFANLKGGWFFCYPFYILLYGLGTFISGRLLQFKPLIIGGIINWVLSATSVFFNFDNQMLIAALAILCGYIIPGYLLKTKSSA